MKILRIMIFSVACMAVGAPAGMVCRTGNKADTCSAGLSARKSVASEKRPDSSQAEAVDAASWPGKKFVLLEKPALYCSYGYELYACPQIDACRGAIDTALFTRRRRARCDAFSGRTLTALSVTKAGAEYLAAFRDPVSGKKLYAKTADGECRELAYAADRDSAEKRWLGRKVFSARGFVSDFSDGKSVTVKVDIRDSLTVTGVRFGLTPLPAKPLWLMVESAKGVKGAIPFRFSWTNTARKMRHRGSAWDDDLYETSPSAVCTADDRTWEAMNAHHVSAGMTREQVRMSWGRPAALDSAEYMGLRRERWTYESQNLYFDEKELAGVENK